MCVRVFRQWMKISICRKEADMPTHSAIAGGFEICSKLARNFLCEDPKYRKKTTMI